MRYAKNGESYYAGDGLNKAHVTPEEIEEALIHSKNNTCYDSTEKCSGRYPSYILPENKNILDYYGIHKSPASFFLLPKIRNFQPIICAYTDSDIEGYELIIAEKGKLISSLKIAEMDGESIQDFDITEQYMIILYQAKNTSDTRKEIGRYRISNNGEIVK